MPEERFRIAPHTTLGGKTMVEYWRDGEFIAGIYPHQDGIRVVSKYLDGVNMEPCYPLAAIIKLKEGGETQDETIHQGRKPG